MTTTMAVDVISTIIVLAAVAYGVVMTYLEWNK